MKEDKQVIYIYMDDSGKMSHSEKCCSYGGVYFHNRFAKDNFKRHYLNIINNSKCNFCEKDKNTCS